MTERENLEIDLFSIESVYQTNIKEFTQKIEKGYKKKGRFTALECFATDLDNFWWCTNEYIKRAELIHANYNRKELLDRLEAYTTEFLLFYKDEVNKTRTKQEEKEFQKVVKKIKGFDYIKTLI